MGFSPPWPAALLAAPRPSCPSSNLSWWSPPAHTVHLEPKLFSVKCRTRPSWTFTAQPLPLETPTPSLAAGCAFHPHSPVNNSFSSGITAFLNLANSSINYSHGTLCCSWYGVWFMCVCLPPTNYKLQTPGSRDYGPTMYLAQSWFSTDVERMSNKPCLLHMKALATFLSYFPFNSMIVGD